MVWIQIFLWVISAAGTWEILRHRVPFHISFLPCLAVAAQVCLLLAAGLLNILPGMVWALWALGLGGFVFYTVRERGRNWKAYLKAEYLFLALAAAALCLFTAGKRFTHYDNFSHWALVVQKMLAEDHFPDAATGITYRGYPLGSSVFVYYAAKVISPAEPVQMMAQGYMMLTCVLPLFSLSEKRRGAAFVLILAAANFFLAYNIPVTELLVDTLLPLAGMCALLFAYSARGQLRRAAPWMTLLLIWVIQIKSSGVFFALMAGLAFLCLAGRERQTVRGVLCVGAALLSLLVWNRHCAAVFPADGAVKHSLSLSWWQVALQNKDVGQIAADLGHYAVRWRVFWLFLLLLAGWGLYCVFVHRERKGRFGKLAALTLGIYLAWQGGLLLVYIFSMTGEEAVYLTSLVRYEKTVMTAMFYALTAFTLSMLEEESGNRLLSTATVLATGAVMCLLPVWNDGPSTALDYQPYRIGRYDGAEVRRWMEDLKEQYGLSGQGDYAILIEDWDSAYFWYMGEYLLPDSDIEMVENATREALEDIMARTILIHDAENPAVLEWVHQRYLEQEGRLLIETDARAEDAAND